MNPDEVYKNKIGERLARRFARAIKDGEISLEESSVLASYILENIDKAQNSFQLFKFLEDLAKKWPIFSQVLTAEQGEITEKKEKVAIEQTSNLINENKIEEAIKVAENATTQKIGDTV